jgi:hypothetical protein
MKSSRLFLTGLAVVSAMLILAASAFAAPAWYTCKVNQGGPFNGTEVRFVLSDTNGPPAFENKTFLALAGCENQMLATALTAISSGLTVKIRTDLSLPGSKVITAMYLVQ